MAQGFDFTDFGEAVDAGADVVRAEGSGGIHRRHVEIGQLVAQLAGTGDFEQQRLVLRDMGTRFADHAWSASLTRSMSARLDISVAQSSRQLPSSG